MKQLVMETLETGALSDILALIEKFSYGGKKELEGLEGTEASQTLKEYIEAQASLFRNNLLNYN
jgi:hypothetical protein